jgi:lysophospholipase L1-like esterase
MTPETPPPDRASQSNAPLSRTLRSILLATPFVLFLGILVGIEGIVRVKLPHISPLSLFVTSPHQQAGFTDRENVSIFYGDPLLFWRVRPNLDQIAWDFTVVSTNEQGLRHVGPIGPKREGSRRIIALGDSVTFGYRVPIVYPQRPTNYDLDKLPYPLQIEKHLRAANPDQDIEVVVLAVPGFSSHQGLAWLRDEIGDLEPDLVIACFGWNDINQRSATDRDTMKMDWYNVNLRRVGSSSQALLHLVNWWRNRPKQQNQQPKPFEGPVSRVPVEHYVDNFQQIAKLARDHGASVAVIGPVYRDSVTRPDEAPLMTSQRNALRNAMSEAGIPYLEIPELMEANYPENEPLFGEVIHPNHRGHQLMASRLLKFLVSEGMLWDLAAPELPASWPRAKTPAG